MNAFAAGENSFYLAAGSALGAAVGGRCLGHDGDVDYESTRSISTDGLCLCEFSGILHV